MPLPNRKKFVQEWIEAWNSHDLKRILKHYSDEVEITSPMIRRVANIDGGNLKGKSTVSAYWSEALGKLPDLYFDLIDFADGLNSVSLYYHSVLNKKTIEVMFFNNSGKVNKIFAHYTH